MIATFSFSEASATNLPSSFWSQQRFSAVVVGLDEAKGKPAKLVVQLPGGWEKDKTAAEVRKLVGEEARQSDAGPSTERGAKPGTATSLAKGPAQTGMAVPSLAIVSWPPACPNVVFTFVKELKPQDGR